MKPGLACLVVAVAALVPYLRLPAAPVIYDGEVAILSNQALRSGPLVDLFVLDFWGQPTRADSSTRSWRPLVSLSWAASLRTVGDSPALIHGTDMLLHAVASSLVVLLLAAWEVERRWLVPAGLLFALHPLQADAVASAVGRADVMAGICLFGALVLQRRAASAPKPALRRACAVALVGAGLLCKEYAVSFPFLLVAADLLPPRPERSRGRIWSGVAAFALLGLYLLARVALFGDLGGAPANPDVHPLAGASLAVRLATSFALLPLAARLVLLPHALNHHYRLGTLAIPESLLDPRALAGVALSLGLVACVVLAWRRRQAAPLLAAALFLLPLGPSLHALGVTGVLFAERFLYVPLAGAVLALGWGLGRLAAPALARGAALLIAFALAALTFERVGDWTSMERLARASLASYPGGADVWRQLGVALARDGQQEDEALSALARAVEINPRDAQAWSVYAELLEGKERWDEAAAALRKVVELAPSEPGVVLRELGRIELAAGRPSAAIAPLSRAHERMPADARTLSLLAEAWIRAGDPEAAVRALQAGGEALRTDPEGLRPQLAHAMLRVGQLRASEGRPDEALSWTRQAVATGALPAAGFVLAGMVARAAGDEPYARQLFDRARSLDPGLLNEKELP